MITDVFSESCMRWILLHKNDHCYATNSSCLGESLLLIMKTQPHDTTVYTLCLNRKLYNQLLIYVKPRIFQDNNSFIYFTQTKLSNVNWKINQLERLYFGNVYVSKDDLISCYLLPTPSNININNLGINPCLFTQAEFQNYPGLKSM